MGNKHETRREWTWGRSFLHTLGIGESKLSSAWFIIAILIGLVAQMTVLISCMSASTRSIYLFRINADDLVNAATNTTTISAADLRIDGLPSYWSWGFSGVCAVYSGGDVSCKRTFPPSMTTQEMIAFAVETHFDQTSIAEHITPWTSALAQVEQDLAPASRSKSFLKAAVALTLISTILSFVMLPLGAFSLTGRLHRWILYTLAFVDALAFLGAGILAIYAMDQGPRALIKLSGIDQGNEVIGPGFYVLFAGVLFILISIELFFCVAFCAVLLIVFLVILCLPSGGGGNSHNHSDHLYNTGAVNKAQNYNWYEHYRK
ncbi:hypothetical protein F5X68DRAFT_177961 [Plectosphaerella plurivora]|uniref:Uncharacterized protein n=1 Tax=Plectosphaerella plurivora TaxID=936078 RepID=A0A9P8V1M2_9PEZI|nr:hypothetical protein F5X68DRAFT_177961 [Plectosphaerella plurivora]